LIHRVGLDGDELTRALGQGRTFSGVTIAWPLPDGHRRRLVTLSAAPIFGRRRELLGFRGFGVLGEEIESAGALAAEQAENARPAETAGFESARPPKSRSLEVEAEARERAGELVA